MKKILSILLVLALAFSLCVYLSTQSDPTDPTTDPSSIIDTTEPETTEPETTEPETTEPETTEPETTEPETTEPETTEPEATDPPETQPKPTDPPATQPKPTDPPETTQTPTEGEVTKPEETDPPSASQQIVDAAFALSSGQKLSGSVTLTGKVTNVEEVSSSYGNATFTIRVQGSNGYQSLYCYRVTPTDKAKMSVSVGDSVTLTGTIQNYNGTIEFYPATYTNHDAKEPAEQETTAPSSGSSSGKIDVNGIYDSKEEVALYLRTYGRLPSNYITKSQAKSQGYPTDKCCGGDRFYNKEGLLPEKSGRIYYECDIDTLGRGSNRGTKRIVYSNDGLIYYTGNHYASFTLLYGTP